MLRAIASLGATLALAAGPLLAAPLLAAPLLAAPLPATPLLAAPLLGTPATVPAAALRAPDEDTVDDFSFDSFDADYYVTRDDDGSSRLRTVETLVADFPDYDQNRGIVRAVPQRYDGADLDPQVISVTDADGEPVPYEESTGDGFLEVATGTDEFVRGQQTYVITYDQRNVTRSYDDTASDEFYWDTNGTGWDQPFGAVTARVHIPAELADALTGSAACYRGAEGDGTECAIDDTAEGTADAGRVLFTASASDLGPGENLTVAIGFDRGTFTEAPRAVDQPWVVVFPAVVAAIAAAFAAAVGVLRLRRWRDARGRGIVVAQYERPDGIDLLEAGELLKRTGQSTSALLIDLAVRGNLRIVDRTPDDLDDDAYSVQFVSVDGLSDAERDVVRAIFGTKPKPGKRRKVGVSADLGQALAVQASTAQDRVREKGWRVRIPVGAIAAVQTTAVVIAFFAIGVVILLVVLDAVRLPAVLLLIAVIVFAVLAGVFGAKASRLTPAGAEMREHLEGMREYIRLAEADRLRILQSPAGAERRPIAPGDDAAVVHVYERMLPFAMLWGLEKEWSAELERLYDTVDASPAWFAGPQPFDTLAFTGFLATTQVAASASTWSGTSGGSGFGGSMGGGFSGGGGGGGGGGGR